MRTKDSLQDKIAEHTETFQEEKADRADIIQNMTRQYKEMQDYLVSKNKELEKKIEKLQDETGLLYLTIINFVIINFLFKLFY